MTRSEAYNGIYDTDPDTKAYRVFFAFSNEQLKQGMADCGYKEYKELCYAENGLFGSREAIISFLGVYGEKAKRVAAECDPQKVYDYEFNNYECDYTGTDREAILQVVQIFGKDRVRLVKRQYARVSIDDIEDKEEVL